MSIMSRYRVRFFGGPADGREFELDASEPNETLHMEATREEGDYLIYTAFVYLRTRRAGEEVDYYLHDIQATQRHEKDSANSLT